jgi:radical SAM superfamily enzyme YgiQ (UPF0313 family)
MTTPHFEQGPIRPPSEAFSLLVRVIRNCTWNRCTFCPVYKGSKASVRPVADVLADVDAMAAAAGVLDAGSPSDVLHAGAVPPEAFQVALFLRDGARSAFLQDADPGAAAPDKVATVIERLREHFPTVERVTTYGRASTVARRTPAQLERLAEAGLSRLHLGLESGCDEVLARVDKGCTAADLVKAGRQTLAAGMELCFYFMPGLGGRDLAQEHVRDTAAVLREVAAAAAPRRPLVVRLRTTAVVPGTPLAMYEARGDFTLPDDVEVAGELHDLLAQLDGVRLELRSDHALNLLPELQGSLPADAERLIALLDDFLTLPPAEQAELALARRVGVCGDLTDGQDPQVKLERAKRVRSRFL